ITHSIKSFHTQNQQQLPELHIPLNLSILKINNNFPGKKSKNGHCLPEKIVSGLIKTNHILIRIELS
ncbi:hypothetical protein, partial [Escherichia coli]|uniref:hypothetical protein n=1 Tax=Escherichia coli TaxID=562 RepID=UPI001BC87E1E